MTGLKSSLNYYLLYPHITSLYCILPTAYYIDILVICNKGQITYLLFKTYSFIKVLYLCLVHSRKVDYIHCHGPYIFDFITHYRISKNKVVYILFSMCYGRLFTQP